MNCVVNDIARVVGAEAWDMDKYVSCIEYVGKPPGIDTTQTDCWLIDRALTWRRDLDGSAVQLPYCPDRLLRPIRDTGARDEVLTYVGEPAGVTA